jgi:hypothetical protein
MVSGTFLLVGRSKADRIGSEFRMSSARYEMVRHSATLEREQRFPLRGAGKATRTATFAATNGHLRVSCLPILSFVVSGGPK